MADALKLQFIIEAVDGVKGVASSITGGVRSMAREIVGSMSGVGRAMDGFSHSYAGIATAIGGGLEIRDIIGDQDTFNRLRVNFDMTEEAMNSLHDTVTSAAEAAKINLRDMLDAVAGFKQAGGDVAKFGDDAKTAAAMVQLLGGQGDAVGQMMAALHKQLNVDDVTRSVAALYEQTKMVPGGFSQFASQFNPIAAQYAKLKLGQPEADAAKQLGAVYAVIADGAKSGRQAASEMQNLIEALGSAGDRAKLGAALGGMDKVSLGGDIIDPRKVLPLTDIVRSIAEAYKADPTRMALMLGPDLQNDLKSLIAQPGLLDQKLAASDDPTKFFNDASEAAKSLTASLNLLKTKIDETGDHILATPFRWLADSIDLVPTPIAAVITGLGMLSIAGNVLPWVWGGLRTTWEWGTKLLGLLPLLGSAFTAIAGAVEAASAVIMATPVGWILASIAAIAAALYGLYELWQHWNEIRDSLGNAMTTPDGGFINPLTGEYYKPSTTPSAGAASSSAPQPRSSLEPPAPDRLPAFGGSSTPAASANNQVNGQITVNFENAPPGLTVKKTQTDNPNVDLDVNMGYAMGMVP